MVFVFTVMCLWLLRCYYKCTPAENVNTSGWRVPMVITVTDITVHYSDWSSISQKILVKMVFIQLQYGPHKRKLRWEREKAGEKRCKRPRPEYSSGTVTL